VSQVTLARNRSLDYRGVVKASLSDIKANSFIGVTGMPQADGSQKAVEIHIFPEALRGTGEGHRPWDLAPNSTMTNATVAQMVKGVEGDEITLKYKDGEKKIVVAPNTTIVSYVPGDKSELKPGAKIFIAAANKKEDGTLEGGRHLGRPRRNHAPNVRLDSSRRARDRGSPAPTR
jgi:hypothetical protein